MPDGFTQALVRLASGLIRLPIGCSPHLWGATSANHKRVGTGQGIPQFLLGIRCCDVHNDDIVRRQPLLLQLCSTLRPRAPSHPPCAPPPPPPFPAADSHIDLPCAAERLQCCRSDIGDLASGPTLQTLQACLAREAHLLGPNDGGDAELVRLLEQSLDGEAARPAASACHGHL